MEQSRLSKPVVQQTHPWLNQIDFAVDGGMFIENIQRQISVISTNITRIYMDT